METLTIEKAQSEAFTSTDRMAEIDPKTKTLKITQPSMIPKTNLPISNKWTVVIQDKAPEQVENKPYTIKFQTPEELADNSD